jgi:hypothetical protein
MAKWTEGKAGRKMGSRKIETGRLETEKRERGRQLGGLAASLADGCEQPHARQDGTGWRRADRSQSGNFSKGEGGHWKSEGNEPPENLGTGIEQERREGAKLREKKPTMLWLTPNPPAFMPL